MINIVDDTADRSMPAAAIGASCGMPVILPRACNFSGRVGRICGACRQRHLFHHRLAGELVEILRLRSRTPLFRYSIGRAAGSCVAVLRADAVGRTSTSKVARFVGADSTIPVLSPPVEPGREQEVLGLVLDHFLEKERCDAVSLSPLSGASPITKAAHAFCATHSTFSLARDDSIEPHTIFRLPQTFDLYLSALQKQQRSNYARDLAHLSKRFRIAHDVISGPHAIEYFNEFERAARGPVESHRTPRTFRRLARELGI